MSQEIVLETEGKALVALHRDWHGPDKNNRKTDVSKLYSFLLQEYCDH